MSGRRSRGGKLLHRRSSREMGVRSNDEPGVSIVQHCTRRRRIVRLAVLVIRRMAASVCWCTALHSTSCGVQLMCRCRSSSQCSSLGQRRRLGQCHSASRHPGGSVESSVSTPSRHICSCSCAHATVECCHLRSRSRWNNERKFGAKGDSDAAGRGGEWGRFSEPNALYDPWRGGGREGGSDADVRTWRRNSGALVHTDGDHWSRRCS